MERRETLREIEREAEAIADRQGLTLVAVEYLRERGRRILRAVIDRPGGVGLEDCQRFSHALGDWLDERDPLPDSYHLEVCSPGLERPLRRDRDFAIFRGRRVRVTTYVPVEGKKLFEGILLGLEAGQVVVQGEDGRIARLDRAQVASARLDEARFE